MEALVDMKPFIGIISQLITWVCFLFAIAMFKNFFSNGLSIAIGEFLINNVSDETRDKIVRWFGNEEIVLEYLKRIDERGAKKEE